MAIQNTGTDIKLHIDKLEEVANWTKWKWQMQMLFVQHKLTKIVDDSEKSPDIPEEGASDQQKALYEKWQVKNTMACNQIMGTLGKNYVELV